MLVPVLLLSAGCDNTDIITNTPPYNLTLSLSADFSPVHGNQPVEWVLIRTADMVTLASGTDTIAPGGNPSYTVDVGDVLEFGVDYSFRYWIDSNIGGGAAGVCDAETIDHQWNYEFRAPDFDVRVILNYDFDRVEDVCMSF